MYSLSKKASQSFASADAKALLYVFCRDMCVTENTLRGVSVELSAISGQFEAQNAAKLSRKSGKATFSTVSTCGGFLQSRRMYVKIYVSSAHVSLEKKRYENL